MPNTTTEDIKVIVLRSKLLEALSSVERSAGGEATSLPILKNVLLKADGGGVSLTATNLETVAEHRVSCKVMKGGMFTVPLLVFGNVIKNLSSERVSLERSDNTLQIVTDSYEGTLFGQSADDFPIVPSLETSESSLAFMAGDLREYLSRVMGATQYSDIRPEISGTHIYTSGHQVFLVATDSFRLAEQAVPKEAALKTTEGVKFTAPIKTVGDVTRIFTQDDERVDIFCDATQVCFKSETRRIISRLVDGVFPDYAQIMPREFSSGAAVNRTEFMEGVKIVSSFSGKGNDVAVRTGKSGKFLEIYCSTQTLGESVYRVPARTRGEGFSVVLNWRYLLDGLKACKGNELALGVNAADKPIGLRSEANPGLAYIIMPIRG